MKINTVLTQHETEAARKLSDAIVEFLLAAEVGRQSRVPAPPVPKAEVELPAVQPPSAELPASGGPQDSPAKSFLIGVREAARLLDVCEKTLWSMTVPRGSIPAIRFGRSVRYVVEGLRVWVRQAR